LDRSERNTAETRSSEDKYDICRDSDFLFNSDELLGLSQVECATSMGLGTFLSGSFCSSDHVMYGNPLHITYNIEGSIVRDGAIVPHEGQMTFTFINPKFRDSK
jgi:hypothetical protein